MVLVRDSDALRSVLVGSGPFIPDPDIVEGVGRRLEGQGVGKRLEGQGVGRRLGEERLTCCREGAIRQCAGQ